MAEENEGADKSYEASDQRLKQARQEGNVPQSPELLTFARYTGILLGTLLLGGYLAERMGYSLMGLLNKPEAASAFLLQGDGFMTFFGTSSWMFFGIILFGAGLAIAALIAQQAITFSPKKLQPKFDKLSIIKNAGQKFGPTGFLDFLKSTVKIFLVMVVGIFIGIQMMPEMMASVGAPPGLLMKEMTDLVILMLTAGVVLAFAAAGVDVPLKWAQHRKKLRMSLQELRDEAKEIEGDPAQKSARRARAREIANSRQLTDVPTADVVIVNPEHYAVALKWDRDANEVPRCVAKGIDHMALQIKMRAEQAGVPVYRDVPTARSLYAAVDVGQEIRRDHYEAVAAAIRFADKLRKKKRR